MPTVVPYPNFDADTDAKALKDACKGFGTDEDTIIEILTNRNNHQRLEIASHFKTMYGKDLHDELKSELRGKFETVIIALLTHPIEFQAKQLHEAISGLGTDEATIIEILSTHCNEDIIRIAQEYEGLYQQTLEEDLKSDSSGTLKRLFVSLANGHRDESDEVDKEKAQQDATELLQAGELQVGTEESTFNAILCQRNRKQLQLVFDQYDKITGHPFEAALDNEFSGSTLEALKDLVAAIRDKTEYLATRLHNSMSGIGTDDNTLIRLVIGRSEIDLGDIKEVFEAKYGQSLAEFIQGDTGGDYKKSLLSIVG